jgi:Zn-dependent peptidase ImmA (M78 family)
MPNATETLDTYWDGKLPVDVKKIATSMGIRVSPNMGMNESGVIQISNGLPVIKYNANEALVRQRFTIAHEIGHFALGHLEGASKMFRDPASNFSSGANKPEEREANVFAARLLMPAKVVRYAVNEKKIRNIERLADVFGVSQVAMKYRLINLGMVSG